LSTVPIAFVHRTRGASLAAAVVAATFWTGSIARAQSLPSNWSVTEIGGAAPAGGASLVSNNLTVTSNGFDVNGASDQFTLVGTTGKGDVTVVAKVSSLGSTDPWSLAGLTLRDSTSPNSSHASVFVTPGNGVVVRNRASARGGTSQISGGSGGASMWLKIERKSQTVTAYRSADGVSWTAVTTLKIRLGQSLVAGVAVASHSAASFSAILSNVTVNGAALLAPAPVVNNPPTVSLNSPAGGATFMAPASISMGATAADSDGSVAKVEFYSGSTLLGSDTTSPYTFSWSNVAAGSYGLRALARDNTGGTTWSSTVAVTVNANQPPTVSLSSPLTGTPFTAPAAIALIASASDLDGSVQKVDFYNGSTLLGSSTAAPFTFTWANVPAGSYSFSAIARDNLGASTVSPWSDVSVSSGSTTTLSTAVFSPAVVPDAIDYYVFEVFPVGSDPAVASPVATQNLGAPTPVNGEINADVAITITGLAPGSYIATVSSVSSGEGVLRSSPFAFTR
jgi:hypothetical protein